MQNRGLDTCIQDVEKISQVAEDLVSQFSSDSPDIEKILEDARGLVQQVP